MARRSVGTVSLRFSKLFVVVVFWVVVVVVVCVVVLVVVVCEVVVVGVVVVFADVASAAVLPLTASINVTTGGVTTENRPHCSRKARLSALCLSSSRTLSVMIAPSPKTNASIPRSADQAEHSWVVCQLNDNL
jgi:hypothetical protein